MGAKVDDLQAIEDFGPVMALSVVEYFQQPAVGQLVGKLKAHGLRLKEPKAKAIGQKLAGQKFVFTGELSALSREQAGQMVQAMGGEIVSTVSSKTSYVVAGENPGSKLDKAKALGVKILNQKQFEEMIHG